MIGIDQDKLGKQCKRVYSSAGVDILAKPLEDHKLAVCFFNKSSLKRNVSVALSKLADDAYLDFNLSDSYTVEDVWSDRTFVTDERIVGEVVPHGVKVYIVSTNQ